MRFINKIILFGIIALILIGKSIGPAKEHEANQVNLESTMNNVIQSTISVVQSVQKQSPPQPKQRVCKIKPNGDEECKYL